MAAAPDPGEVLRSTDGKANFQRLARLLVSGGTSLLREIFDDNHPPSNLPTVLSNSAVKKQLKAAKLTKPQWDCLYPSPGVYGKSADFDVTLLFRLLRTICSLIPPATGWDAQPANTDHSLTADLARIKYYRNSVYAHVNQKMEIPDDQFLTLWQGISGALVRMAAQISNEKKTAWQEAIDDYRKDPLTADDERNVKELERWYKNDMDVKKSVEELKTTTQEGIGHLKSLKTSLKDFQVEFEETSRMMERGAQCLETAVREEAQDIQGKLEEIHHELKDIFVSSVARCRSTGVQLQNYYEDTEGSGTQGRASRPSIIPQEHQAAVQGATVALISLNQPQALITTGIGGENVGNRSIPSAQDVLSTIAFKYVQSVDLSKPEEFMAYLEYLEKMRTVLFNHGESGVAKQILKEFCKNYRTGQVNEMAETFLVAENFLKKNGLIEEYTACRQGALKPPVIDPASMENDDRASDPTENQESLNQIKEQFAQLHRLRVKLHNALLRWIRIRARTTEELESLSTKLNKHHTHYQIMLAAAVGGIFLAAGATKVEAAAAVGTAAAISPILEYFIAMMQQSRLKDVLAALAGDRIACIELQQQFDSLENFISSMANFLKPLHNDPVLLRELEGINFELHREWESLLKGIGSSTRQLNREREEFREWESYVPVHLAKTA